MPGRFELPGVGKPTQPTGGPKAPKLPEPEETALEPQFKETYEMWSRMKSPQANDMMIKSLSPIIDNAVKTFSGGQEANPIIRSRAKKIVIDSLPNYDPTKTKLKTYVFNQLQGLKRFSLQQGQIISIPEKVQLDFVNLKKTEDRLREELGRDPSTDELADASMLSPKRIEYVRRLRMPSSEGTISAVDTSSDFSDISDPAVVSPSNKKDINAWHSFVYSSLSDIDKVIMEHSLGLNGKKLLSNEQIARSLRMSPAAISIRKNKIQQELDKREKLNLL
jgi:DNA-directed RNA polymerase specialized sigma subunit